MNRQIYRAINAKFILKFWYNGGTRTVEPFVYGVDEDGKELLRGYQIGGYNETGRPKEWKLFKLEKVMDLEITDKHFTGERPQYRPRDPDIETVYCCI